MTGRTAIAWAPAALLVALPGLFFAARLVAFVRARMEQSTGDDDAIRTG